MNREGYWVRGKIESQGTDDPVNEGQVKRRIGFDLDVMHPDGHELTSEEIIAGGWAWKAVMEAVADDNGEVILLHRGIGPDPNGERFTDDPLGNGTRIGKVKAQDGYDLAYAGSSALEASNGLRCVFNPKKWEDGNYTFRGSVDGIQARFPGGNKQGFGKADKRRRDAEGKGHE